MLDRRDYHELVERKRSEKITDDDVSRLRLLKQAAPTAEHLTNDPAWDLFLSFIQAAVEDTERLSEKLRHQMLRTDDPAVAKGCRMGMVRAYERIITMKSIMGLPNELRARGAQAEALLDKIASERNRDPESGS